MAKKAYQLAAGFSAVTLTVSTDGKQVHLTPDDAVYETDDPREQDELDSVVARADSGLSAAKDKK